MLHATPAQLAIVGTMENCRYVALGRSRRVAVIGKYFKAWPLGRDMSAGTRPATMLASRSGRGVDLMQRLRLSLTRSFSSAAPRPGVSNGLAARVELACWDGPFFSDDGGGRVHAGLGLGSVVGGWVADRVSTCLGRVHLRRRRALRRRLWLGRAFGFCIGSTRSSLRWPAALGARFRSISHFCWRLRS